MSAKERRERRKQDTRQAILMAARQIAREQGWPSVTIRRIADQVEYTPPIVYEYFANKEAVLLELLCEGFRLLTDAMQEAATTTSDPRERILRILDAYWEFADSHWELYQVMHGLGGVSMDAEETARAALASCAVPLAALEEWARADGFTLIEPMGAVEILWSVLHGLIATTRTGRVEHGQKLAHRAVGDLLTAWRGAAGSDERKRNNR